MFDPDQLAAIRTAQPSFDLDQAIKDSVQQAVKDVIPDGKTWAIVAMGDLQGKVHVGGAVKVGDHVQIAGALDGFVQGGGWSGSIKVLVSG